MATEQKVSALRWARETTSDGVGNLDANGVPEALASYANGFIQSGSVDWSGLEAPMVEQDLAAGTTAMFVPDYVSPVVSGSHVDRLSGDLNLVMRMYGVGDGALFTTPRDSLPGALMESAGLRRMPNPGITSETLGGNAPDANSLTVSDANQYEPGRIICAKIGGKIQYTRVVANDGATDVSISPAFSAAASSGAVIRLCDTYYAPKEGQLGIQTREAGGVQYGNTLSIQFLTRGQYGVLANACRCTSFTISEENNIFTMTATVRVEWAQRFATSGYTSSARQVVNASMKPADRRGSPCVMSTASIVGQTAPYTAGRTELNTSSWSVEWSPAFEAREVQNYLGLTDHDLGGFDATLTLNNVKGNTTLRDMAKGREQRTVVAGAGPFAAGVGLCAVMPGGMLAAEVIESFDSAEKRFAEVPFKPGFYDLDGTGNDNEDYCFAIGLPYPASLS